MGKFSIESVTESVTESCKRAFFDSNTLRSSISIVLSDFCLFHRLTVFPLLKYLVFLLRPLTGRHEGLIYELLLKIMLHH